MKNSNEKNKSLLILNDNTNYKRKKPSPNTPPKKNIKSIKKKRNSNSKPNSSCKKNRLSKDSANNKNNKIKAQQAYKRVEDIRNKCNERKSIRTCLSEFTKEQVENYINNGKTEASKESFEVEEMPESYEYPEKLSDFEACEKSIRDVFKPHHGTRHLLLYAMVCLTLSFILTVILVSTSLFIHNSKNEKVISRIETVIFVAVATTLYIAEVIALVNYIIFYKRLIKKKILLIGILIHSLLLSVSTITIYTFIVFKYKDYIIVKTVFTFIINASLSVVHNAIIVSSEVKRIDEAVAFEENEVKETERKFATEKLDRILRNDLAIVMKKKINLDDKNKDKKNDQEELLKE
uniref:MARVEL domain-containing protein n=1 Tax=Strongyloides papillosus TaxID=174720 RepID=A0A0N5B8S5_STREA